MADYIPSADGDLNTYATNFVARLTENLTGLGLAAGFDDELITLKDDFRDQLNEHNLAQQTAQSQRQAKDASRSALVAKIRQVAKQLQANPTMTDALRTQFGITVPDTIPTAVAAPTSRPVVAVDTANRLVHKVKYTDENTPLTNAKPAGALGCEIYVKIGGDAPTSLDECIFKGVSTKTPAEITFNAEDGGKIAHYFARWATRSGLTGPTSQLTSATIVA